MMVDLQAIDIVKLLLEKNNVDAKVLYSSVYSGYTNYPNKPDFANQIISIPMDWIKDIFKKDLYTANGADLILDVKEVPIKTPHLTLYQAIGVTFAWGHGKRGWLTKVDLDGTCFFRVRKDAACRAARLHIKRLVTQRFFSIG